MVGAFGFRKVSKPRGRNLEAGVKTEWEASAAGEGLTKPKISDRAN